MLWLFVTFVIILLWAIPAFRTLQEMEGQPAPRWRIPLLHLIDEPEEAAVVFFLLGIVFAVGGYAVMHGWGTLRDMVGDFYANIAMECFSVAVTVLIIERLYQRRSDREEKARLILQMGSSENAFAAQAVRQLGKRGWLHDDSLSGADLYRANLSGVTMHEASLWNAILWEADLSGADLLWINLSGASLQDANLSSANLSEAFLWNADLTGANLQQADLSRANLEQAILWESHLQGANLFGANLTRANLAEAKYDRDTKWPDGFDPKAAGAIEVELDEESGEWILLDKR